MTKAPARKKTPKQNRTLNWLLSQAGLLGDDARDYLESVCGKRNRRDMNFDDFKKAIRELSKKTGIKPGKSLVDVSAAMEATEPGKKTDPITPKQMGLIQDLFKAIGASKKKQIELTRRTIKRPWAQTRGDAQSIIQMLTNMVNRGYTVESEEPESTPKVST